MQNNLFPIAFMDPPLVLTASVTNIPAASGNPLQIVSNLGVKAAYAIYWNDTTGEYIGVYTGGAGNEILKCIIGGGTTSEILVVIPAQSRVSLRSVTSTAITSGKLSLTFMGMGFP